MFANRLYMTLSVTDSTRLDLHRVTSTWNSSTLTWNSQPTSSTNVESSVTGSLLVWWNWDATALARDWYNAAQKNYGVVLKANPETANRRSFKSGDFAADPTLRPKLTINKLGEVLAQPGTHPA